MNGVNKIRGIYERELKIKIWFLSTIYYNMLPKISKDG